MRKLTANSDAEQVALSSNRKLFQRWVSIIIIIIIINRFV